MTKEQWKTVLDTVTKLDETARYNVPDKETDFWKIAEELDEKIAELKNQVEYEMEEMEESE